MKVDQTFIDFCSSVPRPIVLLASETSGSVSFVSSVVNPTPCYRGARIRNEPRTSTDPSSPTSITITSPEDGNTSVSAVMFTW